MTADEVLEAIEARRDPALKNHTQDDLVQVHYSEILVLEEAIDELRAQIEDVRDRLNEFNDSSKPPAHGVAAMWQRVFELSYPKRGREP